MSNPSLQSQIMAAVVAALAATETPAYRTRMEAFAADQLPAYNVLPAEGETEYLDNSAIDRKFRFMVRHVAQAANEVDLAVDPLYVAGVRAILADPTLGGLARYTREISQKWDLEKGSVDTVALVVTYESEFETSRSDPSSSPL